MSVAVQEEAARRGCKELQNSGTPALALGFHAGLLCQAALFEMRSEWELKQLLAGDTCQRQSASSHQVDRDQQLDEEKLQLRWKREQHCRWRAIECGTSLATAPTRYPDNSIIRISAELSELSVSTR